MNRLGHKALFAVAAPIARTLVLRSYQVQAVDAAVAEFDAGRRSTYLVLPTGTGKTPIFCEVARRFMGRGRVMIVTHLDTLNTQAGAKVQETLGVEPEYEKAELWSGDGPIVVASRQSLMSGRDGKLRLHRFDPAKVALVIFDEAHLAITDSNIEIARHFCQNAECKVLGVTATPDRADGQSMEVMFESCAYRLELADAIEGGWLTPIKSLSVELEGIEWSNIHSDRGDLRESDLAAEMDSHDGRALHQIASTTIEVACGLAAGTLAALLGVDGPEERKAKLAEMLAGKPRLKTLMFTVRVHHAEKLREIVNRWIPDAARIVVGETPADERVRTFRDYHRGAFQFLIGVGALTTGFDEPDVELVSIGRPTKSRALYAQMCGRGTRPASSVAHELGKLATPEERRQCIASSPKPHVTLLDFTSNGKRHKLVTPFDLLSGDAAENVLDRARQIAAERQVDVSTAIEQAEAEDEAQQEANRQLAEMAQAEADAEDERVAAEAERRRQKLVGSATYVTREIDPFDRYALGPDTGDAPSARGGATDKQVALLVKLGVKRETAAAYSKKQAGAVLDKLMNERCTGGQRWKLRGFGYSDAEIDRLNFHQASEAIEAQMTAGGRQ